MLTRLEIDSFKAFVHAEIPLAPFTMLLGPNGTGKSTILQAIELLGGVVAGTLPEHLQSHEWDYADLPHLKGRDRRIRLVADLALEGTPLRWELVFGTRRYPGIAEERVTRLSDDEVLLERTGRKMTRLDEREGERETIRQTLTSSWLSAIDPEDDRERFPGLAALSGWARGIRGYFFLDPVKLRAPSRGEPRDIGRNGELLAPFLAWLRDRHREAFERLVGRVKRHYPRLTSLEPKRGAYGWTQLSIRERWNDEQALFNARQVSDGLLRLVAVAAMHELPDRPSALLLDEVENGLHPQLLGRLVGMLQDFVEETGTQVLVTTHSPLTVNYCRSADGVLLVHRGEHGHARVRRLSEARGFQKLQAHFDLGELWYNLGEERLLK